MIVRIRACAVREVAPLKVNQQKAVYSMDIQAFPFWFRFFFFFNKRTVWEIMEECLEKMLEF